MNRNQAKEYILILDSFIPALIKHFQIGDTQKMQGTNLTLQQYITLRSLATRGKCTVTELSSLLGVTAGTMSGMLNRLAANHYIKRERDRHDRRIIYIHPTPKSEQIVEKIIYEQSVHSKKILDRLDARDKNDLMRIMNNLLRAINALESEGKK